LEDCGTCSARILARRQNRQLRGPLTEHGRQRLRDQPWRFSTGPVTPDGKAKAALNVRQHRANPQSRRQLRAGLAGIIGLGQEMAQVRRQAMHRPPA